MKQMIMMLIATFVSWCVIADTWTDSSTGIKWTYTVSNGKAEISRVDDSIAGDVKIPSYINHYPVESIGVAAFNYCTKITSITIPSGIKKIKAGAFEDCRNLKSIEIPDSVTEIGDGAFYYCESLKSLTLPIGIRTIDVLTFQHCVSLEHFTIPMGVVSVKAGAFYECNSLTSIDIEPGNESYCCVDGVLYTKDMSTLVAYPSGKVGAYVAPDGVKAAGGMAFSGCSTIKSITFPRSLNNLDSSTFDGCTALQEIVFKGDAPTITPYSSMTFLFVPSSCVIIADRYTNGWDDDGDGKWQRHTLKYSFLEDGGPYAETIDGTEWTFTVANSEASVGTGDENNGNAISVFTTGSVSIPKTLGGCYVTSVNPYAFKNCNMLSEVTFSSTIKTIGDCAFYGCTEMTNVVLSSNLTYIGSRSFRECNQLTKICIPSSVTNISGGAFFRCCNLADVYFQDDSAPTLQSAPIYGHPFNGCNWDLIMHVPATWQGRGRTICGYTVLKGSMFIVK